MLLNFKQNPDNRCKSQFLVIKDEKSMRQNKIKGETKNKNSVNMQQRATKRWKEWVYKFYVSFMELENLVDEVKRLIMWVHLKLLFLIISRLFLSNTTNSIY